MSKQIALERFAEALFTLLEETFERVRGQYLDRGTSLFETLDTISAAEASRPVSATCASLAAQVEHVRFFIDVFEGYMLNPDQDDADWGEIWGRVESVTPEEWEASQQALKASYQRVMHRFKTMDSWEGTHDISAPLAIVAHTAYHLGEIRQALCTIKQQRH